MWQELLDVFTELGKKYQEALRLAERKHRLLVTVNLEGLEALLRQEQQLASGIQALEGRRQGLLRQMAAADKRIQSHTGMAELCSFAPRREIREALERCHEELGDAVARAKEWNDNNEVLILGALKAVNANLSRIGGATVQPTYGSSGQDRIAHRKNFDFQA